MRAVDCQGFAGGFTLGVVQAGFELVAKRELPGGFGADSCLANTHILGEFDYEEGPWESWTPVDVDLVFGNPPCSGFSLLSHKDFRGPNSPINSCMWAFARYAARCLPQVAVYESVQGAYKQGLELMRSLRAHLEDRTNETWYLYHVLHNSYSIGGPSIRPRYFFLASRVPFGVETHPLERVPLVDDVIGDLRGLRPKAEPQRYRRKKVSWWVEREGLRRADGYVDGHALANSAITQRIRTLIDCGKWQSGENLSDVARRAWELDCDVDSLDKWAEREFMLGYNQPYRWFGNRPPRVTTGAACSQVIHPHEPRPVSLREVYRIQGFPDDWLLEPAIERAGSFNKAAMWPGKGIPVQAGRWVAGWIKRALEDNPGRYQGEVIGRHERVIDVTNDWKRVYDVRSQTHTNGASVALQRKIEERLA